MKILCKLFGHKTVFVKDEPLNPDCYWGKSICKRCNYVFGGVGRTMFVNINDAGVETVIIATTGGGGSGGSGRVKVLNGGTSGIRGARMIIDKEQQCSEK